MRFPALPVVRNPFSSKNSVQAGKKRSRSSALLTLGVAALTLTTTLAIAPGIASATGDPDTGRRDFMTYFDQTVDATTGLSVNLANGNLNISSTDFVIPGVTQNFGLERNWSSLRAADTHEFGAASWQFGVTQARVIPNGSGATVYLPGMSPVVFGLSGSTYVAPPGINATLLVSTFGSEHLWSLRFNRTGDFWQFSTFGDGTNRAKLQSQQDRNGNTVSFNYASTPTIGADNWPRLTSITDNFFHTITFTYTGNVITHAADSTGRYVDYRQGSGRLIRAEGVDRGWETYDYYSANMVNYIQTPTHRELALAYDSSGRATSITWTGYSTYGTDPTWTFSYTPLVSGQGTTTLTDPNGNATVYTWDATGKILSVKDALNHMRSTTWTPNYDTLSSTSATGAATTGTHDALNNLTSVQAPTDGGVTGRTSSYQYADSAHPYQPSGQTDSQGNNSTFTYDGPGNGLTATNAQATNNVSTLTYNGNGTVATAKDGKGAITTYGYTGFRLTSITYPSGLGTEYFTYDSLGRVQTHTDGKGQVSTYTYDNLSHITSVAFSGGSPTVSYGYDEDGLLTSRTDAAGNWTFAYDSLRRPTTKNIPGGSSNSATYDKSGNVKSYTDSGGTVNYNYDAANNLSNLAEPGGSCSGTVSKCTTFSYDNDNRRTATNYPNGVSQTVTYDPSGRVKTIGAKKGTTVLTGYTYTYRSATGTDSGLASRIVDNLTGNITDLSYDNMNRLTDAYTASSTGAYVDEFYYEWDANSNRTAKWRNGDPATSYFDHNSNDQTTTSPSATFSYDANGAMTSSTNGFAGTYNDKGQATSIKGQGGSTTLNMTYAGIGQSERLSSGGTTFNTRLIGGLASETTSGTTTSYVMDPSGTPISQKKGSTTSYFLADKLGSIVGLTDTSGNIQQRFSYSPFGDVLTTGITTDSSFKFAGGYYDTATKLYKFGERYYDPSLASWTQRDTLAGNITDGKSTNRYVYVGGDPIDFVDPSGRSLLNQLAGSLEITGAGLGLLGAYIGTAGVCAATVGLGCAGAVAGAAGATIGAGFAFNDANKRITSP